LAQPNRRGGETLKNFPPPPSFFLLISLASAFCAPRRPFSVKLLSLWDATYTTTQRVSTAGPKNRSQSIGVPSRAEPHSCTGVWTEIPPLSTSIMPAIQQEFVPSNEQNQKQRYTCVTQKTAIEWASCIFSNAAADDVLDTRTSCLTQNNTAVTSA